ncbi:MAG: hypothetical protein Q7S95_01735 [bacterium]|nr:hypothetical protein [bacterium]
MWGRRSSALQAHSASRLRDRRRRSRRRFLILLSILTLVLFGAAIYGLWQPAVRISSVTIVSGDSALADYARQAMQGSYFGIVPRDSTFFVPMHRIRVAILAVHSDIAALSISRQGMTGLSIRPSMRTAVGRWCGLAPPVAGFAPTEGVTLPPAGGCYFFDPNGFVYAAVPEADSPRSSSLPRLGEAGGEAGASSTPLAPQTLNAFILYAPLVGNSPRSSSGEAGAPEPLNATLADAVKLPDAFNFARQLSAFGTAASAVVIRGDEADILLASGTRVTYVLGHEQDAYTALASARASFNLANGSVDYVDLRFPGKVYVKKSPH